MYWPHIPLWSVDIDFPVTDVYRVTECTCPDDIEHTAQLCPSCREDYERSLWDEVITQIGEQFVEDMAECDPPESKSPEQLPSPSATDDELRQWLHG